MAKKWIAGAIRHPGALHKELGIKQGKKIPAKTLAKAAKKGGVEGRRARHDGPLDRVEFMGAYRLPRIGELQREGERRPEHTTMIRPLSSL